MNFLSRAVRETDTTWVGEKLVGLREQEEEEKNL